MSPLHLEIIFPSAVRYFIKIGLIIRKQIIQSLIMRKLIVLSVWLFVVGLSSGAFAQGNEMPITIMFWNVENLFDPFDDSLTADEEFTPEGPRHWTWTKFKHKLNNIYKVIAMAGEWNPPDIIGLCEVENRWVLEQLVRNTPLLKYEYRIIHYDSPDQRGIDVAMLYVPGSFRPIHTAPQKVMGLKPEDEPARDILYVKGLIHESDTVHLFINHWPSRYRGEMITEPERVKAAGILRKSADSLLTHDPDSRIIIFGDFNDEPEDISISEILSARYTGEDVETDALYNLTVFPSRSCPGTQKYQGKWSFFDQFIVAGNILLNYDSCCVKVLDFEFLLEEDKVYTGRKPFRTYNGYHYQRGFSDHLPVCLKFYIK